ncbi:unnamed protein product [Tuber melanosporum]|uniref:(Perigord truffle) hypothetical protein n=1 Tax=Tuber melanosporum (strain Mel28) TaxID=656061 RepID=D5G7D2_TUBMM|nr:uncharacterized protein GSTUM_00002556001 [Tuber melanosporum]CAZ80425.1 unnamed protein product [Tuber melanosporum]
MSNVTNKVRDAIASQQDDTTTDRTAGPHRSDMANRADPRVESDRGHHGNPVGGAGLGGMGSTHTAGSTNYGPHDSNIANKVDPRVDSDRDGHGLHNASGAHGAMGLGTGYNTSTNVGPDREGRAGLGSTTQGAPGIGSTGTHTGTGYGTSTSHGPHGSNVGNKLDPRVDSDRDHRASQAATSTGPAPDTAGPHKSDLMNKLDPRVDSNLDGSKTIGADKTYTAGSGATRGMHQ